MTHRETKGPMVSTLVRRRLGMVGLWVVVVVACASLTWLVIERAGRNVGVTQVAMSASRTSAATGGPTPTVSGAAPTPSASESEDESEHPTTHPPATRSTTRPPSGPSGSSPSGVATSAPAPQAKRATFTTEGGTVTALCTGTAIRLDSATPRDGYRLHQESDGRELEVSFTSGYVGGEGDGESSQYDALELHLSCQSGIPAEHY